MEFDPEWPKLIGVTRERLASLPEEDRERLRAQALEKMSRDSRPFVRIFVTTGPSGDLEPRGRPGEEMMLKVIGEILASEPPE